MRKKVLLADDSVTIQKVVKIILAEGEYNLQVADNGDAALDKVMADRPDIVLADVYMPGKNGYELCSAVKQDAALAGLPVLLLSGTFEAFDESKALAVGADGWIAKPFESQALLEKIEELLARPAAVLNATDEAAAVTEGSTVAAEPDMWADLDVDTLGEEEQGQQLADASAEDIASFDEVELETEDLWDEETLSGEDEQALDQAEEDVDLGDIDFTEVTETAADSDVLSSPDAGLDTGEEEILFLDENDLLIEDASEELPQEEDTFEFVTLEESATEAEVTAAEPAADSLVLGAEDEAVTTPVEKPAGFEFAEATTEEVVGEEELVEESVGAEFVEETAPEVCEEAVDIVPEAEVAAEPETEAEPETAPEPAAVAEPAAPEADGLNFFRSDGLISRLAEPQKAEPVPVAESAAAEASGLSYFRNAGLISRLAGTEVAEPVPVVEPEAAVAAAEPVCKEAVVERVQGLSEEELTAIVEQVAGKVIERLASTMLERIAWEVVPDLAESLIKEEISRITASQD